MTEKWEPAFPMYGVDDGMSLRDYFAAKALQGLVVSYPVSCDYAKEAYKIADAMLKARQEL